MENVAQWTQESVAAFVYSISSDFVAQLETKMEKEKISRSELASRLDKSNGRVSQVFNDPGNLGVRLMVEYARALGLKVSIIAYDDGDPENDKGPISPDVFVTAWQRLKQPRDLFGMESAILLSAAIWNDVNTYLRIPPGREQKIAGGEIGPSPPMNFYPIPSQPQESMWTKIPSGATPQQPLMKGATE